MLQAKDLRICNLVNKRLKSGNGRTIIARIGISDFEKIFEVTGSFIFEPISLTEEILKNNFGFKKTYKIGNKKYFEHSEYRISFTVVDNCFVFDFGPATIGQRGYVHEVQNLFKELTQKDIEINL